MTGARPQKVRRHFEERTDPRNGEPYLAVYARGAALQDDPILNKGTCFSREERDSLGLRGILPPAISTAIEQEARAYENFLKAGDDVGKYLFLAALQDRNETLFYRLIVDHLDEMVPIIYTPTVGKVCQRFSHIYRRPRGVYVSTRDRGHMIEVLRNAERADTRIIVATDSEAILGLGDQGVGGIGIAIGKLSLYTAGAGIHPARTLPIGIDVGTDNPSLLEDPLYLGVRHPRLRGDEYVAVLDELVEAIRTVFPQALVQWEDFANERAFLVLRRYRDTLPSFDDDIQGTAAIVEAGVRTALDRIGRRLDQARVLFFGAGASGAGCAVQLRNAMRAAGVDESELARRILCLDSQGLILSDRAGLHGHKADIAADPSVVSGWKAGANGRFGLEEVVRQFKPTILIGVSGQRGAFTEAIVRTMQKGCVRPIVLALSNPDDKVEATPEQILRWTNGAAIVATGSPFPPVELDGLSHDIGQCNNAFVFPGIGLGAMTVKARRIPDVAFAAAAQAVYDVARTTTSGSAIFPPLSSLRSVSHAVAIAVARALVDCEAAPYMSPMMIEEQVTRAMWEPLYMNYRPA